VGELPILFQIEPLSSPERGMSASILSRWVFPGCADLFQKSTIRRSSLLDGSRKTSTGLLAFGARNPFGQEEGREYRFPSLDCSPRLRATHNLALSCPVQESTGPADQDWRLREQRMLSSSARAARLEFRHSFLCASCLLPFQSMQPWRTLTFAARAAMNMG